MAWLQLYLVPTEDIFNPVLPLPNDTQYPFYTQSWGAGGVSTGGLGGDAEGWVTQEFSIGTPPPGLVTNMGVSVSNGIPTFTWTSTERANAYRLWVGTIDGTTVNQAHFETHTSADLGCATAATTCTFALPSALEPITGLFRPLAQVVIVLRAIWAGQHPKQALLLFRVRLEPDKRTCLTAGVIEVATFYEILLFLQV